MMRSIILSRYEYLHFTLAFILGMTSSRSLLAESRSGLDGRGFDRSVRVQDDLYLAVNGSWLRDTEIPADKSNYGSFTALDDLSAERIREIIEGAAKKTCAAGSNLQKVGDLFRSFMDEQSIAGVGISPLRSQVEAIRALATPTDVFRFFGKVQPTPMQTPVGLFVDLDDKDSTQYLAVLIQSGTTLPDRDYYLEDDEKYIAARRALKDYVETLWKLRGEPVQSVADDILQLETRLAQVQWEKTELRDAEKRYNKYAVEDLAKVTPGLAWKEFLAAAEVGQVANVNLETPSFFVGLVAILNEVPVAVWQQYLEFKLFDGAAPYLAKEFEEAHFQLHERILADVPEQKPRWKRGVELVAGAGAGEFGALGDVLGQLYVEKHFPAEHKERMEKLVQNLLRAYEQSIDELKWMTPATKARAQEKLSKIVTKIGYPTKWRDYSALEISPDDLFGNVMRSAALEYRRMTDKLGKPVDREEWGMTPQTVNAYYNPGMNEIVFPAAILQPPFFSMEADDAVNYGGIGAVIGHEISHAFDDQGSKYDADGNLNNWWSPRDRHQFKQLTKRLIDQYNKYEPLPGKNVNGELTLGENIADLSGLSIAHRAYNLSLNGSTPPEIESWTGDQRFFLGWSQVWRRKYRDAEMIKRLLIDPHSPSWYRANGPVCNIDAFFTAFGVQPGDALYQPPEERIRIW